MTIDEDSTNKKEVIWIDDEAELYMSYAEFYSEAGIHLKFIKTLTRAKKEIEIEYKENLPDAILLDIMMPGFDPLTIKGKHYRTNGGHIAGLVFYKKWLKEFLRNNLQKKVVKVIGLTNLRAQIDIIEDIKSSGMIYIPKSNRSIIQDCVNIILKE
jgi:CheY-like chemotaxis protein